VRLANDGVIGCNPFLLPVIQGEEGGGGGNAHKVEGRPISCLIFTRNQGGGGEKKNPGVRDGETMVGPLNSD